MFKTRKETKTTEVDENDGVVDVGDVDCWGRGDETNRSDDGEGKKRTDDRRGRFETRFEHARIRSESSVDAVLGSIGGEGNDVCEGVLSDRTLQSVANLVVDGTTAGLHKSVDDRAVLSRDDGTGGGSEGDDASHGVQTKRILDDRRWENLSRRNELRRTDVQRGRRGRWLAVRRDERILVGTVLFL